MSARLPRALVKFVAKIHTFDTSKPIEGEVSLLDGTFSCPLYVRKVFPILWDAVQSSSNAGIVLFGEPGIGKSCWLLWVLIKLVQEGQAVIWQTRRKQHTLYYFKGSTVRLLTIDKAIKLLGQSTVYYLVDGSCPLDDPSILPIKAVAVHTPDYREFKPLLVQQNIDPRTGENMWSYGAWYMPGMDKLEKSNMARYYGMAATEALRRHEVYGGNARLVFDFAQSDRDFHRRDGALSSLTWDTIVTARGCIDSMDDVRGTLFTIRVPEWEAGNFIDTAVEFSSEHMRKAVFQAARGIFDEHQLSCLKKGLFIPSKVT
ncbi:hypothetical protein WJX72_002520 [[Myrmecia] bisecta]|uniref:Uncharacterized protein n=1 Tax=[Myrmecia] bisecta TaxID=41462 RepID=A0AAW1R541_9CHLO